MAVLSVAITLSFHLNNKPSDLERRMSKPLGAVFWVLSVFMLGLGVANYISTFDKPFTFDEPSRIQRCSEKYKLTWRLLE